MPNEVRWLEAGSTLVVDLGEDWVFSVRILGVEPLEHGSPPYRPTGKFYANWEFLDAASEALWAEAKADHRNFWVEPSLSIAINLAVNRFAAAARAELDEF